MAIINFVFIYFFLILSIIGYGYFFFKILNLNIKNLKYYNNCGYIGIYGIYFLTLLALFLNLFFSLNDNLNLIIILLGFIFFLKNFKFFFKDKSFFFLLFISIFCIFFYKNHDDFPYYHYAYISNITNYKLEFGLGGNFDISLNHFSSIFFISALLKNYFTEDFFYFVIQTAILLFTNSIFIAKIFDKEKVNLVKILTIFSLIFINVFFYRIPEHGTDRSAQILLFLLLISLLEIISQKKENKFILEFCIILITLMFSFKSFYFLYTFSFIFIYFKYYSINNYFDFLKKYKIFFFSIVLALLVFTYNFASSGCLVYPIHFTCPSNIFWSYGIDNVKHAMSWYEQWAKGGAGPGFRVADPENYIQSFNWIGNWFKVYFFNKVSDSILGLLGILLVVNIVFVPKKLKFNSNKNFWIIYICIWILFIFWFYKNPALRYGGGYALLALLFFYPNAILLSNQNYSYDLLIKKVKIIFLITMLIFISRNINNIFFQIKKYNYSPLSNPHYYIGPEFKNTIEPKNELLKKTDNCKNNNSIENRKCKKILGYNFYYR